tara:strand:- start:1169 stop:2743 length:1575 start_codon:yes stop_codon:yes gene_type:complete
MQKTLFKVSGLGVASNTAGKKQALLNNIDLTINTGETIGLIGETGSGKSMLGWALMDLLPKGCFVVEGSIKYGDTPISEIPNLRGKKAAMVFQDPMQSLNPTQTIGKQIKTILGKWHGNKEETTEERAVQSLERVQLGSVVNIMGRYPHQLSGGQMQRVMIALAISTRPHLIIADEITTGLDANIKLEIMDLLFSLQDELGVAVLLISHDLIVIKRYCDKVAVMRSGEIVDNGITDKVFLNPKGEYVRSFLNGQEKNRKHKKTKTPIPKQEVLLVSEFEKSYGDLQNKHTVVKKVSMVLCRGNTLGLIGESGSGKTTLAKMILNILERDSGRLKLTIDGLEMENLITPHRQIGAVMQDSAGSLNPRMNIHEALSEPLELMGLSDRHVKKRKVVAMMNDVGLDQELLMRYPHSLSGGQRQRVSLARAMMLEPSILILDEPTSALDVNVQKKILELLKSLQKEKNLSYLFISHDLAVISEMANDVGVMYDGEIVEFGSVEKILNKPEQAYTQKLVDSSVWTSATET